MDLFDYVRQNTMKNESPLASRIRPETLDEVVGQQHIIGKDKLLYRAIQADKISSIIFYGPPGTGKTTLAKVIANTTSADFKQINATVAGKRIWKMSLHRQKIILECTEKRRYCLSMRFIDLIKDNRIIFCLLSRTEQLSLLVRLQKSIFEVNGALISRSIIFELKPLDKEDIKTLIKRAVYDEKKGMGSLHADIDDEALTFLADVAMVMREVH